MTTKNVSMLGKKVKDTISGFEGIVIEEIKYLNGCIQYKIQPRCKEDGKFIGGKWFDVQQLQIFKTKEKKVTEKKPYRAKLCRGAGGPGPDNTPNFGK